MEDDLSDEHNSQNKPKGRGRKRCIRIDNTDSDEDIEKNYNTNEIEDTSQYKNAEKNTEIEEVKNNLENTKKDKQIELQKKLKFIFNEVREKGKYEYNKQEIPDNLKYHSDESESSHMSNVKRPKRWTS